MKFNRLIMAVILVFFYQTSYADEGAQATRAKVGMDAPAFRCRTVTGEDFSLREENGKVILINFFATWCGPCLVELPHLEKEIYQKYKNREDFRLIVIGREHNASELKKFMKKKGQIGRASCRERV